MSIRAADLRSPVIHHADKCIQGSRHVFGKLIGYIIGGFQQQHVQALLYRKFLPFHRPRVRAAGDRHLHPRPGHGNDIGKRCIFQYKQSRHDLGRTGGITDRVAVQGIHDPAVIGIHNHARFLAYLSHLRPALHHIRERLIRRNMHCLPKQAHEQNADKCQHSNSLFTPVYSKQIRHFTNPVLSAHIRPCARGRMT